jgi:hypothetical protein
MADLIAIATSLEKHLTDRNLIDTYKNNRLVPLNFTATAIRNTQGEVTGVREKLGLRGTFGGYDSNLKKNERRFIFGRAFVVLDYQLEKYSLLAAELSDELSIAVNDWGEKCVKGVSKISGITTKPMIEQDEHLAIAIRQFIKPTDTATGKSQFWVASSIIGFELTYN